MAYKHAEEWERRKQALRSDEDFYAAEAEATKDVFDIRLGLVRPGRECRVCGEMRVSEMYPRSAKVDGHDTLCRPHAWEQNRVRVQAKRDARRTRPYTPRSLDNPGFVYRVFDEAGALLYLGETTNVARRFYWSRKGHAALSPWWPRAVTVTVSAYATKRDAQTAEAFALTRERPPFNKVGSRRRHTTEEPKPVHTYTGRIR